MRPSLTAVTRWLPLKARWFHILLSLAGGRRHGYAIRKEVEERTAGRVRLWPTALYGSIGSLSEAGLIREASAPAGSGAEDPRRIYYELTRLGRDVLRAETARLAELVALSRSRDAVASSGRS